MKKLLQLIYLSFIISISILNADTKSGITNTETIGLIESMDVNKIDLPIQNDGSTGDDASAYYPNGQTMLSFLFQGGFATTAIVNGELRASWLAKSSLMEEWQPGTWGMDANDPLAKFYIVYSSDTLGSNAYQDWVNAVNLGADFQDVNKDGIYDPYVDRPDILGDKTIWFPVNDGTTLAQRTPRLGTKPIGLEMHITVWAWQNKIELEDVIFFRYRIINVTDTVKNDIIFSIPEDVDLGDADDDLLSCDTLLNIGYIYNDNDDLSYGVNPPAHGVQFMQGARVFSPGDTAYNYRGKYFGIDTILDYRNLGMTSYAWWLGGHPILNDPNNAIQARYFQIGGLDMFGNPIDPTFWGIGGTSSTNPRFGYSGDPVSGSGWIDNSPNDARMIVNSGPFQLAVADTQDIIVSFIVGQGINALNSIEVMKQHAAYLYDLYPAYRLLQINSNSRNGSIDSIFVFNPDFSSAILSDSLQSVNWYLLSKPISSMAMIIPNPDFSATLQPDMVGTYTIQLQAIISSGDTLTEYLNVEAVNNHPPHLNLSITPDVVIFGDKMMLDASGTIDPDGDSLHFDWLIPDWLGQNPSDTSNIEFYPPHTGSDYLELMVNDIYFSQTIGDSFYVLPLENGLEVDKIKTSYTSVIDLEIYDNKLFILDENENFNIVDIITDSILISNGLIGADKFITDGTYIISGYGGAAEIGQLDSIYNYSFLSNITLPLLNADMHLEYPYLYLPVFSPRELQVYNISNPQNPNLINSYSLPILTRDVTFSENVAALYTSFPTLGVITLDISNPNSIVAQDTINLPFMDRNIEYGSEIIFALNGKYDGNEIIIIDASDAANLQQAMTLTIESIIEGSAANPILDMRAENNYLFVYTVDGVKMFDVTDPYNPIERTNYHTGLNVSAVAWKNPFLYTGIVGDTIYGAGLNILDYDSTFIMGVKNKPIVQIPQKYKLYQNYPNPFNPTTNIKYELPKSSQVKIEIFDILGQSVNTLVNQKQSRGAHEIVWDGLNETGKQVSSGIYFYSLQTENFVQTKKMLIIR